MVGAIVNRLLATLSTEDYGWLEPHFDRVDLRRGTVLAHDGETLPFVYFPISAVVSLVCEMRDGRIAEMATFGREAMVGLVFAGIPLEAFGKYVVQIPGTLLRVSSRRMQDAVGQRPGIQEMVLRYTEILMVLTLQSVACNTAHGIEARCCRWIIGTSDRIGGSEIPLTHEYLAQMLGVQRSTVSEVTRGLQHRGLIGQGHGTMTILDRAGLEQAACECYGILREKYLQLLPRRSPLWPAAR